MLLEPLVLQHVYSHPLLKHLTVEISNHHIAKNIFLQELPKTQMLNKLRLDICQNLVANNKGFAFLVGVDTKLMI